MNSPSDHALAARARAVLPLRAPAFHVLLALSAGALTGYRMILFHTLFIILPLIFEFGAMGAVLVGFYAPVYLAILAATFEGAERGKAVGTWTAWTGIATVLGPAGETLADAGRVSFVDALLICRREELSGLAALAATAPARATHR